MSEVMDALVRQTQEYGQELAARARVLALGVAALDQDITYPNDRISTIHRLTKSPLALLGGRELTGVKVSQAYPTRDVVAPPDSFLVAVTLGMGAEKGTVEAYWNNEGSLGVRGLFKNGDYGCAKVVPANGPAILMGALVGLEALREAAQSCDVLVGDFNYGAAQELLARWGEQKRYEVDELLAQLTARGFETAAFMPATA